MILSRERDPFFQENERKTNMQNSLLLMICTVLVFILLFIMFIDFYKTKDRLGFIFILFAVTVLLGTSSVICRVRKGNGIWIKYLFLVCFLLTALVAGMASSTVAFIGLFIPVILSCWYVNVSYTLFASFLSAICIFLTSVLKTYVRPLLVHDLDARFVRLDPGTVITFENGRIYQGIMDYGYDKKAYFLTELNLEFKPVILVFLVVAVACVFSTKRSREMILKQRDDAQKKAELEVALAESRTQVMLSQIQPHFIYNMLNTICVLCEEDTKKAQVAIQKFAAYLRVNLNSLRTKKSIPFSQELEHIRNYISLEQMRFEDRVSVRYEIEEEDFMVPALSIQPLVENAIRHGLCKKRGGGTVIIRTEEGQDAFIITIQDDGIGFDPDKVANDGKSHIGIENARQRLSLMSHASLEIQSTLGEGTLVKIIIPDETIPDEAV